MSMSFRFREASGVVTALEVHDPDGIACIDALYRALLTLRVQLVKAVDTEIDGKPLLELSVCELDGARVKPARQRAILAELQSRAMALAVPVDSRPPIAPRTPLRAA
jgi:hypothetical protein